MIDYFAANLWQLWALVVIVCLILEITSGDFFILCFSIGALVSAVIAAVGGSFAVQLEIFAVVSVLSLFFIRPRLVKRLHGKLLRLQGSGLLNSIIPQKKRFG